MIEFQGAGFKLELPDDAADASTFAFVLRPGGSFKPTAVVRRDRKPRLRALIDHVVEQRKAIVQSVARFELVSETIHDHRGRPAVTTRFEWDLPDGTRVAQSQLYVWVVELELVYCLTLTDRAAGAADSEALFAQVLAAFEPNDQQVLAP
jgi:hypothetical protein